MEYVAYFELGDRPNVIVDGAASPSTILTLSHWPGAPTPAAVQADLSAEIAMRYLEQPELHVRADVVSNNHFDEDGLMSLYALVAPEQALARRELVEDVARAGDFGRFETRDAARVSFAISTLADPTGSPLGPSFFERPYEQLADGLYTELLNRLPELLDDVEGHRPLWEEEDDELTRSERAVESGEVTIEDQPRVDLAIVTVPESFASRSVHRFTQQRSARIHPMAVHNRTDMLRTLTIAGSSFEVAFRYETWVQLVSRRPMPRVDLSPLAERLNGMESGGSTWSFDGVGDIVPRLHLDGSEASSTIAPDVFMRDLTSFLESAPPAWDPYSPR
jgi:hypothetical protein